MPPGTRFEDILEAPPDRYRGEPLLLKPGLVFVVHMPAAGGFAYGKFLVEDITLERSDGLPLKGREPGPWQDKTGIPGPGEHY